MRTRLLFFFFLLLSCLAFARTNRTVSGILHGSDRQPLAYATVMLLNAGVAHSQDLPAPPDASILESRFSTNAPLVGESFKYFLKFDHLKAAVVRPELHVAEHGIEIIETQQTPPQEFQGRVIEQFEYTLKAVKPGQLQFSPATLMFTGPRASPSSP